jgi:hypothetical protein
VLVRIDIEKDPESSYMTSGARAVPALVPYTPKGEPISIRVLSRDADGRTKELDKPERMITGWQRPQELATNLKRILRE